MVEATRGWWPRGRTDEPRHGYGEDHRDVAGYRLSILVVGFGTRFMGGQGRGATHGKLLCRRAEPRGCDGQDPTLTFRQARHLKRADAKCASARSLLRPKITARR